MDDWIPPGLVALPLAGALLGWMRQRASWVIAALLAAGLLAGVGLVGPLLGAWPTLAWTGWRWIDGPLFSGRLQVEIALSAGAGALASVLCATLLAVAMARAASGAPEAARASLWSAGAALVLMAEDLAVLFAGWSLAGLAGVLSRSELRGGSWARARIADGCVVLALALLVATSGSFDLEVLSGRAERLARPRLMGPPALWGASAAAVVGIPLALAIALRLADAAAVLGVRLSTGSWPSLRDRLAALGGAAMAFALLLAVAPMLSAVGWSLPAMLTLATVVGALTALAQHPAGARLVGGALRRLCGLGTALAEIDRAAIARLPAWAVGAALDGGAWCVQRVGDSRRARVAVGLLAAASVAWWLLAPQPELVGVQRPAPMTLELRAADGPGYEYLWDFDSDGAADTAWSAEPHALHEFGDEELWDGVVVLVEPGVYGPAHRRVRLSPGARLPLDPRELGPLARRRGWEGTVPWVEATARGLRVRPNGVRARVGAELVESGTEVVELAVGQSISFGATKLSVTGVAAPTLYVRNAFGLVRSERPVYELPLLGGRPVAEIGGVAREGK